MHQNVQCGHPHHEGMGNCPTPEDLSDVVVTAPLEIRYPLPIDTAMAIIALDTDALAYLRDQWINLSGEHQQSEPNDLTLHKLFEAERSRIVTEMLREGLSLRQVARYLDLSYDAVVRALFGFERKNQHGDCTRDVDAILECDDLLHRGTSVSGRTLSAWFGVDRRTINRLRVARTDDKVSA